MFNCHARSGRDKDVKFFSVPSIAKYQGEMVEELLIERRTRWIAAISRDKLTEDILRNDRVCSRHFVSGRPAASWDKFNVDWVPSLNLGHTKSKANDEERQQRDIERAERAKLRHKRKHEEALIESAAKSAKLDEPGELVKYIFNENPEEQNEHEESTIQHDVDAVSNQLESLRVSPKPANQALRQRSLIICFINAHVNPHLMLKICKTTRKYGSTLA